MTEESDGLNSEKELQNVVRNSKEYTSYVDGSMQKGDTITLLPVDNPFEMKLNLDEISFFL